MRSKIWRKIKRWVRLKPSGLTLAAWGGLLFAVGAGGWALQNEATVLHNMTVTEQVLGMPALAVDQSVSVNPELAVRVVKRTEYICGVVAEEKTTLSKAALSKWKQAHPNGWMREGDRTVLTEVVEDLAPLCKTNGYFGLNEAGELTLFNGVPKEAKAIQTFFRINIKRMESGLPHEPIASLYQGIRIKDLAEYNSVLSTFSEFAVDK